MADINLLPEEFREKERKEIEAVKKKPKEIRIGMTSPALEERPEPLKQPKQSLLSRLFARKVVPTKPFKPQEPAEEKVLAEATVSRPVKKYIDWRRPIKEKFKEEAELRPKFGPGEEESKPIAERPLIFKEKAGGLSLPQEPVVIEEKEKVVKIKERRGLFAWLKSLFSFKLRLKEMRGKSLKISNKLSPELTLSALKEKPVKEEVVRVVKEKVIEIRSSVAKPAKQSWLKSVFSGGLENKIDKKEMREKKKEKKPREKVNLDINLIPEELAKKEELGLPRKILNSGLIIFILALLIWAVQLGLIWYQLRISRQIQDLKLEIQETNEKIAVYEGTKLEIIDFGQKLKLVQALLTKHIYWTKFFELLEKYTIEEVYYTNFAMAGTEKLVLSAAGKDYESVAKQLVAFQEAKDFVAQAEVNSASAQIDEDGSYLQVNFNINLTLVPEVFLKPIE